MKEIDFKNVTDLSVSLCPGCGAKLNAAAPSIDDPSGPRVGDYSMCFYCGEYLRFDDDMRLQVLSEKDIVEAPLQELAGMRQQTKTKH